MVSLKLCRIPEARSVRQAFKDKALTFISCSEVLRHCLKCLVIYKVPPSQPEEEGTDTSMAAGGGMEWTNGDSRELTSRKQECWFPNYISKEGGQ